MLISETVTLRCDSRMEGWRRTATARAASTVAAGCIGLVGSTRSPGYRPTTARYSSRLTVTSPSAEARKLRASASRASARLTSVRVISPTSKRSCAARSSSEMRRTLFWRSDTNSSSRSTEKNATTARRSTSCSTSRSVARVASTASLAASIDSRLRPPSSSVICAVSPSVPVSSEVDRRPPPIRMGAPVTGSTMGRPLTGLIWLSPGVSARVTV